MRRVNTGTEFNTLLQSLMPIVTGMRGRTIADLNDWLDTAIALILDPNQNTLVQYINRYALGRMRAPVKAATLPFADVLPAANVRMYASGPNFISVENVIPVVIGDHAFTITSFMYDARIIRSTDIDDGNFGIEMQAEVVNYSAPLPANSIASIS